jgi:CarboxypepD_reg-like domain
MNMRPILSIAIMNKIAIVYLIIFFFFISLCFGQNQSVAILRGVILNSSTGEAVSYATISLPANGINTMSNEEGHFIFKIPTDIKEDSFYVSHVGYKPVGINIRQSDTGFMTIKLQESFYQLPDVVVNPINALDLVKKAIAKIPDNYPTTPFIMNGFYRMTGMNEKKIIDISEAVFEVYSEDFERKNKQFKLIKSRIDRDESATAFNGNYLILGENPNTILHEDIVSEVNEHNLLNEERLKLYDFTFNGIADYNGREAYDIGFDQKDGVEESNRKGKLFLDVNSLAFLEFDYGLSPKGMKYWKPRSLLGVKVKIMGNKVTVTYKKYGNKYYINHVQRTTQWHITGGKNLINFDPLIVKVDYLFTKIDTVDVKAFRKSEVLSNTESIENQAKNKVDDNFWESYNLIQADFNVDSVVAIMRDKNRTNKK